MNFNDLYFKYKYPYYSNYDDNQNYIMVNCKNKNFNYNEYLVCNEITKFPGSNSRYYILYIKNSIFKSELYHTRIRVFSEFQNFNLKFSRLLLLIKQKIKKPKNNLNVLLEELKKRNIKVIQENNIYQFDYFEMYKIIKESFLFTSDKEIDNIGIKNPYTNIKFNYALLVQIYFFLFEYGTVPELYFLYFKCNFSDKKLKEKYLINLYINNFINEYSLFKKTRKLKIISLMLHSDEEFMQFDNINKDLKFELFSKIAQNFYLERQIESYFCLDYDTVTKIYFKKYNKYLKNIKQNNPKFGRVFIKNKRSFVNENHVI